LFGLDADIDDLRIQRRAKSLPQNREQFMAKPRSIVTDISIRGIIEQRWAELQVWVSREKPALELRL